MTNTNSKILMISFGLGAALIGYTVHLLIKIFAGAFGVVARATDTDLVRHGVPVAVAFVLFLYFVLNPRIRTWGEEVVAEIRKVVYPTLKDTRLMTMSVIIMILISSSIIWSFDAISGYIVKLLMR